MGFIVAVSAFIIPLIIFYVVVDGIIHQTDVYDVFVEGAKDGMKTVVSILPTLIGLMMAVGILRASGFLAWISANDSAMILGDGMRVRNHRWAPAVKP